MAYKPLTQVRRRPVQELAGLRSENRHESVQAGLKLTYEAKEFGLNVRDFLELAIDVPTSEQPERYRDADGFCSGYEAAVAYLGLPSQDNFQSGTVLDAASDTFQVFPGTRSLFPAVVDDVVQWRYRQDQLETTAAIVAQSRTISGIEMITTVIPDQEDDYRVTQAVAELGRVPVKTIRAGEQAVRFFKHGGGLRLSYEFERRVRLDMLTPYQTRMNRETERSKVWTATGVLINGDGVNPAASTVSQASYEPASTSGKINYKGMLKWLISRAQKGTPVDTVLGNWDAYFEWLMLFAMPTSNLNRTDAENLAATGFQIGGVPLLTGSVNFALSSAVPAGKLIGYSRGDTLEELIEAGSDIQESERAIQNQSISYVKTLNSGYKIAFPDTREIYDFGT